MTMGKWQGSNMLICYTPWRISGDTIILTPNFASSFKASHVTTWLVEILCYVAFKGSTADFGNIVLLSRVSCKKGLTRHAYAWQIGPFWQDTLVTWWLCKVEDAESWSLLTWPLGSPVHSLSYRSLWPGSITFGTRDTHRFIWFLAVYFFLSWFWEHPCQFCEERNPLPGRSHWQSKWVSVIQCIFQRTFSNAIAQRKFRIMISI